MPRVKVLIVDDDRDLVRVMSAQLRADGLETVTAGDGLSAMRVAQRERPDAIILDIGLPGGDGFSVLKRLSRLRPLARIPVIVLTAREASEARPAAMDAGAFAFLEKPASREELLTAILLAVGTSEEIEELIDADLGDLEVDEQPRAFARGVESPDSSDRTPRLFASRAPLVIH